MGVHVPGNFGDPYAITQYSDSAGPAGLWEPSRSSQSYRGGLFVQGGSMRETGKGPFSEYTSDMASNEAFWAAPPGEPKYGFGLGG